MTQDQTIDQLWERAGHGTRREDIEAAYLAGMEAERAERDRTMVRGSGLLVDAIVGRGLPTSEHVDRYTRAGLARFSGNQWNEEWQWDRAALEQLAFSRLVEIYRDLSKGLAG